MRRIVAEVLIPLAGMGLLVYGLTTAASHSWGAGSTIAYLTAAAAILVFFVFLEAVEANRSRAGELAADHGGHLTTGLQHQAVVHGYDVGFLVGALIACVALGVSIAVLRLQRRGPDGTEPAVATAAAAT